MPNITDRTWLIPGASRDGQSITAEWQPLKLALIDGVHVLEVRNVPKQQGWLTEVFRADWALDLLPVDQVFQVSFNRGAISAWHAHEHTTDRIFVNQGLMNIVLFDGRPGSPTEGRLNEFKFGTVRPALVLIPPKVWHGIQNIGDGPSLVLNLVDRAYDYESPDHWRLDHDSPAIPYQWPRLA